MWLERQSDAWSTDPTGTDATLALFASIHFIFLTIDPSGCICETNRQGPSASAESFDVTGQLTAMDFLGSSNFGCRALSGDVDIVIK